MLFCLAVPAREVFDGGAGGDLGRVFFVLPRACERERFVVRVMGMAFSLYRFCACVAMVHSGQGEWLIAG